jgi:hypothetical protein
MKASLVFDDPRWDVSATERKLKAGIFRGRKELKEEIKKTHREGGSNASGTVYARRRGTGFRRGHRASSRGSAPAPDTLTLTNAIDDQETGPLSGEVYIKHDKNPFGGYADEYGEILDDPNRLDRPFFESTAAKFEKRFDQIMEDAIDR